MEPDLNDQVLATLLSLHDAGELKRADRITAPGARARWRLTTSKGTYVLVLVEDRPFWDLVHEKDLALFLAERTAALGHDVPRLVPNIARGYFFPFNGRFTWLMEQPRGRVLGVFEVDAAACARVGRALGRFHVVARAFRGRRRHASRPEAVRAWLTAASGAAGPEVAAALQQARLELAWLRRPLGRLVPRGTLHGSPGPAAFRFHHGELCHVGELGESSSGPLVMDVAHALCLWAVDQGTLAGDRVQALLHGYATERPVGRGERRALYPFTRFAALRLMAGHVRDYELRQRADEPQGYRAFTPYLELLGALRTMGRHGFRALTGPGADAW